MRRTVMNLLIAIVAITLVFGFVSCKPEPLNEPGVVNVSITDNTTRNPVSYKLTFKEAGTGKILKIENITGLTWSGEVPSGVFVLSVDAFSNDAKLVGHGSAVSSIEINETQDVAVSAKPLVILTVAENTTVYDNLEDAVAVLTEGQNATIAVNGEITVKATMTITDLDLTLTNLNGEDAIINDGVMSKETDTGSTANQVARMFQISGSANLTVQGNTSGTILFKGASKTSAAHNNCNRRVLFFLGVKNAEKATGKVTLKDGVEVTGIYCDGATSFGTVIRGYGNVQIDGGYYHDNYQNGNGLFCVYGTTVVNGGTFDKNISDGSSSIIQNASSGANLTINGGRFTNNSANYACVITVAGATTTVNNGTFTGNRAAANNRGAALHGNNDATVTVNINGGTFADNDPYDYYRNNSTLTVAPGVSLRTN